MRTLPAKVGLPELAGEIRREHEAVEAGIRATVIAAIRCGELLTEAKSKVQHGEWYSWLESNFPSTPQTATGYMRLAANREQIESASSIRGALRQLAAPSETEVGAGDPPSGLEISREDWATLTERQREHLLHLTRSIKARAEELEHRADNHPDFAELLVQEAKIVRADGVCEVYAQVGLYFLAEAPEGEETSRLRSRFHKVLADLAREAA